MNKVIVLVLLVFLIGCTSVTECPDVTCQECPDCICGACEVCEPSEECIESTFTSYEVYENNTCPSGLNAAVICDDDEYVHWYDNGLCKCKEKVQNDIPKEV